MEERNIRVAHKQKYTRGAVGHMLGHYDRSKTVPELKASLQSGQVVIWDKLNDGLQAYEQVDRDKML